MRRAALQSEKNSLIKDLSSISPKVSTYNKIINRIQEIDKLLNQNEQVIQKEAGRIPVVQ